MKELSITLSSIDNIELREFIPKLLLAFNDSNGKNNQLADILIERGLVGEFLRYCNDCHLINYLCQALYSRHKCDEFFITRVGNDAGLDNPEILEMVKEALSQTQGRLIGRYFGMVIDDEF
jgi:hypothetical protein